MVQTQTYDYDFFVIGAGSAGVRASRMAAGFGARVGVCEERYLGGTCVNVGCVPKKLMVIAARFANHFADARGFAWTVGATEHDWAAFIATKDTEIGRLNETYGRMLDRAGVELIEGRGRLLDAHTVDIGGRRVTAEHILIGVGGWPRQPTFPGAEHCITSNEAFFLPERPRRVVVVGGGYIGVEFACIFNGLGTEVVQLYRGPLFLRGFDHDVRTHVAEQMRGTGIDLRFDADVASVARRDSGELVVTLQDGQELEADTVLVAIGRVPNTADLGLAEAGVATDARGAIVVDDDLRTNVPSIFACGDVIDRVQLTPVALAEGMAIARNLYGGYSYRVGYENVPSAVFSCPEIATVGLTEAQARERFDPVRIYRTSFRAMRDVMGGRNERALMKLIVDGATDRVVGCHMVGSDAGETIQGFAVALQCGATKAQFDRTIGIHPTIAEEMVTMRTAVDE